MAGHHPVGHGKSAPTTPAGWVDYWTDYYNRSKQLKKGQPGELECYSRGVEEKTCPSPENTLSEVHRNYQAMAQNLRVRTRKTRPEREHIPTWQDKKNKLLKRLTFSRVSRSQQSAP